MYIIGHLDQGSDDVAKLLYLYRQQDVRATEIDKVDMHLSFAPVTLLELLWYPLRLTGLFTDL